MPIVAGSIACLERLGRLLGPRRCLEPHRELLWKCLRLAVGSFTTADDDAKLARYEVPSKALRFLARHAPSLLDKSIVSSGALAAVLPKLRQCALSSAGKIKAPGGDAYEACFAALGARLAGTEAGTDEDDDDSGGAAGAAGAAGVASAAARALDDVAASLADASLAAPEAILAMRAVAAFVGSGGLQGLSDGDARADALSHLLFAAFDRVANRAQRAEGAEGAEGEEGAFEALEEAVGSYGDQQHDQRRGYFDLRISTLALRSTAVLVAALHGSPHGSPHGSSASDGSCDSSSSSNVSEALGRLGRMVEVVLVDFPYASGADRAVIAAALAASFEDLAAMGALESVLGRSGRAGVLLAAGRESQARPQSVPVYDPDSGAADPRLCWAYAQLWSSILTRPSANGQATASARVTAFCQPLTAAEALQRRQRRRAAARASAAAVTFSFLLGEVLSTVAKLDLALADGDGATTGAVVPLNVFNHDLLLNLTAFLEATLGTAPAPVAAFFRPWAGTFFRCLVGRARDLPEVSALYRLLGLGLRLADTAAVFSDGVGRGVGDGAVGGAADDGDALMAPAAPSPLSHPSPVDAQLADTQSDLVPPLRRFLAAVSGGLGRFSDELLCACLGMVLSAPPRVLPRTAAVPALAAALVAGRAHLPTAAAAVGELEAWQASDSDQSDQTSGGLDEHLPTLLPLLEAFLFDASTRGAVPGASVAKGGRGRRQRSCAGEDGAALEALQLRVVRLLGRLGGRNRLVAVDAATALRATLGWGEAPPGTLPIEVPLSSKRPAVLQVPELLPRLAELCLGASEDRQAKALAAETLHACVLLLVGTSATDAGSGGHYIAIWAKLFPVVVALAADPAVPATRVLFGKLLGQLVHWLSGDGSREEEAGCLLAALSDGIAAQEQGAGAVRALCAASMAEFLR